MQQKFTFIFNKR